MLASLVTSPLGVVFLFALALAGWGCVVYLIGLNEAAHKRLASLEATADSLRKGVQKYRERLEELEAEQRAVVPQLELFAPSWLRVVGASLGLAGCDHCHHEGVLPQLVDVKVDGVERATGMVVVAACPHCLARVKEHQGRAELALLSPTSEAA